MTGLTPRLYQTVEQNIRKEYIKTFGEDIKNVNQVTYSIFTEEEQIERYAKNLKFWHDQIIQIKKPTSSSYNMAHYFIVSNTISSLNTKLQEMGLYEKVSDYMTREQPQPQQEQKKRRRQRKKKVQ